MCDDIQERLADIRERARWAWTTPACTSSVTVSGTAAGLAAENAQRQLATRDVPLLLDVLEAVLDIEPSMHGDHGPIPEWCRRCQGERYVVDKIQELVGRYLEVGVSAAATSAGDGAS